MELLFICYGWLGDVQRLKDLCIHGAGQSSCRLAFVETFSVEFIILDLNSNILSTESLRYILNHAKCVELKSRLPVSIDDKVGRLAVVNTGYCALPSN